MKKTSIRRVIVVVLLLIVGFLVSLGLSHRLVLYTASTGKPVRPTTTHIAMPESRTMTETLKRIAFCESSGSHYNADGTVKRGKMNKGDLGLYQINLYYHGETAEKMGLNLFLEEDNEKYALYLYKTQGTKPWKASEWCWSKD